MSLSEKTSFTLDSSFCETSFGNERVSLVPPVNSIDKLRPNRISEIIPGIMKISEIKKY